MVFEMHASNGGPVLPQEVGGPSTGAPSVEPTLPATSQIKEYPPFSESRNQSRHRRQGRHWYKRPNGKGKQAQHAPQPEEDHRQNQYQDQGQPLPQPRPQHQHRPPVKVVVDRPDYFNFNPSNGLHTPGLFHPGAYGYGPQPVGYFAPPPPLLMPMPLLSPQFDPFSTSLAALPAEHHKQRLWDEMEESFPMWTTPQRSIDPLKIWTGARSRQAGYPLYYQRSILRPWANEFVPGRLFHQILGW